MNNDKLEVSRELLERATKDYTGRPNWDSLEPDRLVAIEELRALLAKPPKPFPGCVGELERFEADDGEFVRLGDVIDMLANKPSAQHQGEPVAPIAWHIGGNGYDKVEFTYPSWVGELGNGRPSVSEICTVDDLAELLARIGALRAPHHHPAEHPTPKTFLQERAQLDQEWAGLRELQRLSRQPAPVAMALPERKRADYHDESQDVKSYFEELGWNACLDEVTRLNTK